MSRASDGKRYPTGDSVCDKFGIEGQLRAEIEHLEQQILDARNDPKKQAELRRQKRREIERHLDRLREGSLQDIGLQGTAYVSHLNNGGTDGIGIHLEGPEDIVSNYTGRPPRWDRRPWRG